MDKAERSAGWLQSLKEELKTEAEEYGIGSFIYRARYIHTVWKNEKFTLIEKYFVKSNI